MEMSVVVFYRDLRGEFDPVQEITPIDLVSGSTWTQTEKEENIAPEENEDSGNDYNAEA